MSEIKERVKQIIAEISEKEVGSMDDTANLFEDLNFDSIFILQLVSALEVEWKFSLTEYPELLDEMETMESLLKFLDRICERNG